jgi:hypothetical protein
LKNKNKDEKKGGNAKKKKSHGPSLWLFLMGQDNNYSIAMNNNL